MTSRILKLALILGFSVELLRAAVLWILHPLAHVSKWGACVRSKASADRSLWSRYTGRPKPRHAWHGVLERVQGCLQNCFRNVPTGLKGSRYPVDTRVDTKPTRKP